MDFGGRLVFFILTIGLAWFLNSEKVRFNKLSEKAYADKDEYKSGQYDEKVSFYSNALSLMFFVIPIMFIYLLSGSF